MLAGTSVFGFGYRHFFDVGLLATQYKTWICAYPVVLFMAPFGAFVLSKINVEWMIKGIVVLNIAQLAYFNINRPSVEKLIASLLFMAILLFLFLRSFARLSANTSEASPQPVRSTEHPFADLPQTDHEEIPA
jgi:hypothetical protein